MTAEQWLTKLSKYYWSPEHPSSYTFKGKNGEVVGIGTLAAKDFGAFNIVWASHRVINTPQIHLKCIQDWCLMTTHTSLELDGATLGTWLTLLNMNEFMGWLAKNSERLPKEFSHYATRALLQIPTA